MPALPGANACWRAPRGAHRDTNAESLVECLSAVGSVGRKMRAEAAPGFEPGNGGFADLCLTTWLCRRRRRAGDRARTGDPNLGKVVLYQLSYTRIVATLEENGLCAKL